MIDLKDCDIFEIKIKSSLTRTTDIGAIYHIGGRLVAFESFDSLVLKDWVISDRSRLTDRQIEKLEQYLSDNEALKLEEGA